MTAGGPLPRLLPASPSPAQPLRSLRRLPDSDPLFARPRPPLARLQLRAQRRGSSGRAAAPGAAAGHRAGARAGGGRGEPRGESRGPLGRRSTYGGRRAQGGSEPAVSWPQRGSGTGEGRGGEGTRQLPGLRRRPCRDSEAAAPVPACQPAPLRSRPAPGGCR